MDKEKTLYSATLYYLTPNGERYNGNFRITPTRVIFSAQAHLASDGIKDVEGEIIVAREDLAEVTSFSHWLIFNRLRLTLKNGQTHIFDRGVSSMRTIVKHLKH